MEAEEEGGGVSKKWICLAVNLFCVLSLHSVATSCAAKKPWKSYLYNLVAMANLLAALLYVLEIAQEGV